MDNGQGQVMPKMSAKELTQMIDQETSVADWRVLDANRPDETIVGQEAQMAERMAQDMGQVAEQLINTEARQELKLDQDELEHPEESVGDETELQINERLAGEKENFLNEINPKRDADAERVAGSQQAIAQVAMREVERLMGEKQMSPAKIMEIWRKQGDMVLNSFENPHPIGKGN